ncbi:MAG: GNAT family N-acetyltransferase [Akkermansiaceae bacterium]|jgi:ribosomal-protein-serine acetyltransferase|nr:GNAT family N-acetyltransferase [Akkermansiaceae bacterium]
MFSRVLTHSLHVSLSIPHYADELYELTDRNRQFLRRWLPWLDGVQSAEDTRRFLALQVQRFARGESLHVTIFSQGSIAGVAAFNSIDRTNGIGSIGYWLGEEFNGKGIMTSVVRDLVELGRTYYSLQKVEIRCATGNLRSRAIPERLGFRHEGTLRRAERVYEQWFDHEVYALLIDPLVGGQGDQANEF